MENDASENRKEDLQRVYKTIFLFLKNQNFQASSETFRRECEFQGCQIPDINGGVLLVPTEKRTYTIGNQTEPIQSAAGIKNESFILESSFQEFNAEVQRNKESYQEICNQSQFADDTDQINKLNTNYGTLKARFFQLHEEHKKLIAVTAELTNALQLNIIGQTKNMHHVLDQCKTIYPTLFIAKDIQTENVYGIENIKPNNTLQKKAIFCSNLSNQEPIIVENIKLSSSTTANVTPLNLDVSDQSDKDDTPHCTPRSEKEIRDLVEIILLKVIEHLNDDEIDSRKNCCGDGRACEACRSEISKIVERVLEKVLESPRYKISPRNSTASFCQNEKAFELNQCQSIEKPFILISDISVNDQFSLSTENPETKNIQVTEDNINDLKRDLFNSDVPKQTRILQSLRWELTKSDVDKRKKLLQTFINNDLLYVHAEQFLLEKLIFDECTILNEYTLYLLNTISSFRLGRKYLSSNDKLLKLVLLPKFQKQYVNSKSIITDMLVAILQKLSLQGHYRKEMDHAGLIEYLIQLLDKHFDQLSLYNLEHSMALLMNLCLMKEAQEYCNRNAEKIVSLLKKFLNDQYTSCWPCMSGMLLSILIQENIVSEARKEKMDELLRQVTTNIKDEYMLRQLSFLIRCRFSEQIESFIGDDDECPGKDDILDEFDTDIEVNEDQVPTDEEKLSGHRRKFTVVDTPKYTILQKFNKETQYYNPDEDPDICKPERDKMTKTPFSVLSGAKNRKVIRRLHNFPNSSFCYLEICVHDGTRTCRCNKCQPGKNRYSCGCYDIIRKELSEEIDHSKEGTDLLKYAEEKYKDDSISVEILGKNVKGKQCAICGEKKCDCAFESRPKIHRTPPKT